MPHGSFSLERIAADGALRRRPPAGRARVAAAASLLPLIALGLASLDGAALFAAGQLARLMGVGH